VNLLQFPKYGEPTGQAHMRQRLRGNEARQQSAADIWSHLPLATRQAFCSEALGINGLEVYKRAWEDIPPPLRIKIGATARRLVERLL